MTATGVQLNGLETTVLLYRDWIDGALLTESDTRATSQLLGNPAVRQYLNLSERFTPKEIKRLQTLDLVRQKSLFGGPYLWFNFISRSIAHSVACLLIDYNQNAWGQTLASVYSVRPSPRAGVSMPVTWREVVRGIAIDDFRIDNAPRRIKRRGDLWEPLLARKGRVRLSRFQ